MLGASCRESGLEPNVPLWGPPSGGDLSSQCNSWEFYAEEGKHVSWLKGGFLGLKGWL